MIVCWHPDRLHRSPKELEHFIDLLELAHVTVATVTAGDRDFATPDGRFMARLEGTIARRESEHKSERIRSKHRQLAEKGTYVEEEPSPVRVRVDNQAGRPTAPASRSCRMRPS